MGVEAGGRGLGHRSWLWLGSALCLVLLVLLVWVLQRPAGNGAVPVAASAAAPAPVGAAPPPLQTGPPDRASVELAMRHAAQKVDTAFGPAAAKALVRRAVEGALAKAAADEPPVEPAAGGELPSLVWNYWIEERPAPAGRWPAALDLPAPRQSVLRLHEPLRAWFRLSTLDLARRVDGVGRAQVPAALRQAVSVAMADPERNRLDLAVLVLPFDEQRLRIADTSRRIALSLDLEQLRALQRSAAASMGLAAEAAHKRLLEFPIDLTLLVPGRHQLVIAIVDDETGVPLQTLTAELQADARWPRSMGLAADEPRWSGADMPAADLTLMLVELKSRQGGSTRHRLVLVLRWVDPTAGPQWAVWRPRVEHFDDLRGRVRAYVEAEYPQTDGLRVLEDGLDLGRTLFDDDRLPDNSGRALTEAEEANRQAAARARRVLHREAARAHSVQPATLLVQLHVAAEPGQVAPPPPVLPVGALGVPGDSPGQEPIYLGNSFVTALLVPGSGVGHGGPCAPDWYLALPPDGEAIDTELAAARSRLAGLRELLPDSERQAPAQSLDMQALRGWLRTRQGLPHVFGFVGHHNDGTLAFDGTRGSVPLNAIDRDFGGTSVAVISACNGAVGSFEGTTFVGQLLRQRTAAAITTTSKVRGALAADYLLCLHAVLDKGRDLPVGLAHLRATRCLWSGELTSEIGLPRVYTGKALKYLLIGNPFQRVCAPARPGSGG